jgi:hypothetical protein
VPHSINSRSWLLSRVVPKEYWLFSFPFPVFTKWWLLLWGHLFHAHGGGCKVPLFGAEEKTRLKRHHDSISELRIRMMHHTRLKALRHIYRLGLLEACCVGHTDAYLPCFPIAFDGHYCRTTQLGLGVQHRCWHCYSLNCTLLPEPMAEAATRTKGPSSLGQCPGDA